MPRKKKDPNAAPAPKQSLATLFDKLIAGEFFAGGFKNDAALARALKVAAPDISKARRGSRVIGNALILALHETFDIPVKVIRSHIKDMPA
ncbi:MAG: hypothetical protein K2X55_23685 [Burkholderiaceae bacterium]|nr:hypothetical protein [Burkholderiaceae bacterium]